MICGKFPLVFTVSFTLAVLLTMASASTAQTATVTDQHTALPQPAPTTTTLQFSEEATTFRAK